MMRALASLALGNLPVAGGLAGLVMLALGAAYWLGRRDGAALARAEQAEQVERVIDGIASQAERARAMRRHCNDSGLQYDPEHARCVR